MKERFLPPPTHCSTERVPLGPDAAGITGVCTPRANLAFLARLTLGFKPNRLGYCPSNAPERIRTPAVPGPKPGALPLSYGGGAWESQEMAANSSATSWRATG